MSKRNKGDNNSPKTTPGNAAKKAQVSTAIQQDLDNEEEVTSNEAMADPGLDIYFFPLIILYCIIKNNKQSTLQHRGTMLGLYGTMHFNVYILFNIYFQ